MVRNVEIIYKLSLKKWLDEAAGIKNNLCQGKYMSCQSVEKINV